MRREFCIYKRNDKKYYYYTTYINGKRVFKSTGKKTKSEAMNYCLNLLANGLLHSEIKNGVKFSDFANNFFSKNSNYQKQENLTETTRLGYEAILEDRIIPYFKNFLIQEISPPMIRNWILSIKDISPQTKNRYLLILSLILKEACFQGIINYNPVNSVKRLQAEKEERAVFTLEEIKKLFSSEWKSQKIKLICKISALTGMRSGEIRALTLDKIKPYYIIVDASIEERFNKIKSTKNGKSRIVPITENLYNEILLYANNTKGFIFKGCKGNKGSITGNTLLLNLKEQLKKVGITRKGLTFHSFRHFFNSQLVLSNVKSEIIRKIIGHETEEMTDHYLHINQEELDNIRTIQTKLFF